MINSFLVSLHNSGTAPVNPSSLVGDVLWPDPVELKTYSGAAAVADGILFNGTTGFDRFLIAIQLLWVVEESVLADTITYDDRRVTYTRAQLAGQFIDQSGYDQQVSRVLDSFSEIKALDFLQDYLLSVYRSALSPLDRLAAVIAEFGLRND